MKHLSPLQRRSFQLFYIWFSCSRRPEDHQAKSFESAYCDRQENRMRCSTGFRRHHFHRCRPTAMYPRDCSNQCSMRTTMDCPSCCWIGWRRPMLGWEHCMEATRNEWSPSPVRRRHKAMMRQDSSFEREMNWLHSRQIGELRRLLNYRRPTDYTTNSIEDVGADFGSIVVQHRNQHPTSID